MSLLQLIGILVLDTSASWLRMFVALALSVVISILIGILAARSEKAERVILPIVDIFQTLPILAFFPFVIFVVVGVLPGWMGVDAAVIFLIVTSMLWNMIFGVYEAVKTLPTEYGEVASLYKIGLLKRLSKLYIPAAIPRLVEQSELSWAIGLFYLVTSEIFSTGNSNYSVTYGIGVALTQLATSGNYTSYIIGFAVFVVFIVATRYLFFRSIELHVEKRGIIIKQRHRLHAGIMHRFRLFRELERIAMPRQRRHERKPMQSAKTAAQELHPLKSHKWYKYTIAGVVVVILLYLLGAFSPTYLNYEGLAFISLIYSFARIWLVFAVILLVSVPLCVYLIFIAKRNAAQFMSLFQILASIPATIVLPIIALAVVGFPHSGEIVAVLVFFLSGIWYVVFSVMADARSIPEEIFEVKGLFSVKGMNAWKNIYVKSVLPGIITGGITAIAAEWNASIVAEYFTTTGVGNGAVLSTVGTGIGKLLDTSLASGNLTLMAIALINLTIMIILINTFVWKKLYRRVSEVYK